MFSDHRKKLVHFRKSSVMRKLFLMVCILFFGLTMNAQSKPVLNHVAIYVVDLQKSTVFYRDLIGIDTIPEPFHDGKHTWFRIGPVSHLHVIAGAKAATPHDKNVHLCFRVDSVTPFVEKLKKAGVVFEDYAGTKGAITTRVDGVKQIWFMDPDGYWIEINDAKD
jgi:lactoylglutathione lyase